MLEITYLFITIYYCFTRYLQGPTEYANIMAYFDIFHYPWAFNYLSFLIPGGCLMKNTAFVFIPWRLPPENTPFFRKSWTTPST